MGFVATTTKPVTTIPVSVPAHATTTTTTTASGDDGSSSTSSYTPPTTAPTTATPVCYSTPSGHVTCP